MKVSLKNVLFGALIAGATLGVLTATAAVAQASGECIPCDLEGSIKSGYMVASGLIPVCEAVPACDDAS